MVNISRRRRHRKQLIRLEKLWKMKFEGTPIIEVYVPRKRGKFSKPTKKYTVLAQGNRCKICGIWLEVVDFDHIDGDRSNNHWTNCQALCPNCHAKKTRRSKYLC